MMVENKNLKELNTFGISANCKYFIEINSIEELQEALKFSKSKKLSPFILGGGSNLLLTQDIDTLVIHNNIKGFEVVEESENEVVVEVGAGEVWHELVMHCIEKNWGGLENLSLIPGRVGASPMQNIGAYGVEIKDVFEYLKAVEIATENEKLFDNAACEFGYRESVFKNIYKNQFVICKVAFRLTKNQHQLNTSYGAIEDELNKNNWEKNIANISKAVINIRQSKLPDPKEIGNAGSFFKNPVISQALYENILKQYPDISAYRIDENNVKIAAGWLIEKSGWKGKKIGNHGVHDRQALVLVNYGNAEGKDILALSTQIIEDIQLKFGIKLEREVNII
jgi:UDP-N-acetylmuramate dehydrogenase